MFSKDGLAVDIGSSYTKVLLGDKQKVKLCGLIKTPEGSVVNNNIVDTDAIKNAVQSFLNENKVKPGQISFAIHGQDIVMRHMEIPLMPEKNIKQTVEWEIGQNLPENGNNYIIDYEILNKVNTKDKKVYELLVVAAPRGKINSFAKVSSSLNLKLNAIDVSANCISRVFKTVKKENVSEGSMGIIDIGYTSSSIIIIDKGKLFIEREVAFGVRDAVEEISRELSIDEHQAYAYLFEKFNIFSVSGSNVVERNIQQLFENALVTFDKIIQFYTNGKTQKTLDLIYLIGGGCEIPGIGSYVREFLGSPVEVVDSVSKLPVKSKFPESTDVKVYLNALGLLLRKE